MIRSFKFDIGILEAKAAEPIITNTWTSGNLIITLDSNGEFRVKAKPGTNGQDVSDYLDYSKRQWYGIEKKVKSIYIEDGVGLLNFNFIANCVNCELIRFPATKMKFQSPINGNFDSLEQVIIPDGFTNEIGWDTSLLSIQAPNLVELIYPDSVKNPGNINIRNAQSLVNIKYPSVVSTRIKSDIMDASLDYLVLPNIFSSCYLNELKNLRKLDVYSNTFVCPEFCPELEEIHYYTDYKTTASNTVSKFCGDAKLKDIYVHCNEHRGLKYDWLDKFVIDNLNIHVDVLSDMSNYYACTAYTRSKTFSIYYFSDIDDYISDIYVVGNDIINITLNQESLNYLDEINDYIESSSTKSFNIVLDGVLNRDVSDTLVATNILSIQEQNIGSITLDFDDDNELILEAPVSITGTETIAVNNVVLDDKYYSIEDNNTIKFDKLLLNCVDDYSSFDMTITSATNSICVHCSVENIDGDTILKEYDCDGVSGSLCANKTFILSKSTDGIMKSTPYKSDNLAISKLVIEDGVYLLAEKAFERNCTIKEIDFGNTLEKIPQDCFFYCMMLENIDLPDSVYSIGKSAFGYCCSVISIDLNCVETVENYAFKSLNSLESINFGNKLESIGYGAFNMDSSYNNSYVKYTKVTEFMLPYSLKYLGEDSFIYNSVNKIYAPGLMGMHSDAFALSHANPINLYLSKDSQVTADELGSMAFDIDWKTGDNTYNVLNVYAPAGGEFEKKNTRGYHSVKWVNQDRYSGYTIYIKGPSVDNMEYDAKLAANITTNITFTDEQSSIKAIKLLGEVIDESRYTLTDTTITFNSNTFENLKDGSYTIEYIFNDDYRAYSELLVKNSIIGRIIPVIAGDSSKTFNTFEKPYEISLSFNIDSRTNISSVSFNEVKLNVDNSDTTLQVFS